MGPILDRTKENLSAGDAAVVHARRMLLDALAAAGVGERPPGSALSCSAVRLPNAFEAVLEGGQQWQDMALEQRAG
jgi:hypothetical protein